MKYLFRPLIVVAVCCAGLLLSVYSYADVRSGLQDNVCRKYNDVSRYQKDGRHNDHHCDKWDCKRCRKYNRNSRRNRQGYFLLRSSKPYFYFSFGRNDGRSRCGTWNKVYYRDDRHNYRHGHHGSNHYVRRYRKCR